MRNEFLRILSTPAVQAAQQRIYGRSRVPHSSPHEQGIGEDERTFIAARDSFYLASIGEDGWPYIQHRGGPKGFVQVTGEKQLTFADYTGNRQLISTGNVTATKRVALFFMDYRARERLKLIGHARVLSVAEAGDLLERLSVPPGVTVERVFVVDVVGFDWNCPKYITPRFTTDEIVEATEPLRAKIAELENEFRRRSASSPL